MRYINDIIKSGNVKSLKTNKGKTLEQLLLEQAQYLKELILKNLADYRRAFKPQRYRRTGGLERSMQVSASVKCVGGVYTAYVYFDENALHRSGFGAWAVKDERGKYDDDVREFDRNDAVNTAVLINQGYVVYKPVWFRDYPNFGYRGGNGFVDRAIMEFNATNSLGITLDWRDVIQGNGVREW